MLSFTASVDLLAQCRPASSTKDGFHLGLLLTLQKMPKHGVVIVFLDSTTKDQDLLDDVVALRDEKEIKIFVVYAPKMNTFTGSVGDPSWTALKTASEGRIYDMSTFNRTLFISEVTQVKMLDPEGDC